MPHQFGDPDPGAEGRLDQHDAAAAPGCPRDLVVPPPLRASDASGHRVVEHLVGRVSAGSSRQGRRRSGAGTVGRLPSGRWQARRSEADGTRVSLGPYRTRGDAEHALVLAEADELRGERVLDSTGTVAEWAARWLDRSVHWKPSTRAGNEQMLHARTLPRWGKVELSAVARRDVEAWVAEMIAAGAQPDAVRASRSPPRHPGLRTPLPGCASGRTAARCATWPSTAGTSALLLPGLGCRVPGGITETRVQAPGFSHGVERVRGGAPTVTPQA